MISFTLDEVLLSVLGALLFASGGAVYEFLLTELSAIGIFFSKREYCVYKKGNNIKRIAKDFIDRINSCGKIRNISLYQFLFTVVFGVFYLVLQYVFCDGVFRGYFLFTVLTFFFIFRWLYKRYLKSAVAVAICYFLAGLIFLASLPITLLYKIFRAVAALLSRLLKKIRYRKLRLRQKNRAAGDIILKK